MWAIAGPQLMAKYERFREDEDHPEYQALARLIMDWYRTGHTQGIPRDVAETLLAEDGGQYAPSGGRGYSRNEFAGAVAELAEPIFGTVRDRNAVLTVDGDARTLAIHDYIRDSDTANQGSPVGLACRRGPR